MSCLFEMTSCVGHCYIGFLSSSCVRHCYVGFLSVHVMNSLHVTDTLCCTVNPPSAHIKTQLRLRMAASQPPCPCHVDGYSSLACWPLLATAKIYWPRLYPSNVGAHPGNTCGYPIFQCPAVRF